MTDSDWASAFRPNNVQNQPAVPTSAPSSPAPPSLDPAPRILTGRPPVEEQNQMPNDPNLVESILSSVAEMFMLLEQREAQASGSLIENESSR